MQRRVLGPWEGLWRVLWGDVLAAAGWSIDWQIGAEAGTPDARRPAACARSVEDGPLAPPAGPGVSRPSGRPRDGGRGCARKGRGLAPPARVSGAAGSRSLEPRSRYSEARHVCLARGVPAPDPAAMCWVAVPLPAVFAKTWEASPPPHPPFLRPAWTLRQELVFPRNRGPVADLTGMTAGGGPASRLRVSP
ncbi:unnamed protein product [Rangifer tarandus platyrhynchus]|uniref:Uncharacterized protein n=1 Tax=Rangifer tarandus platyrhynchus TaxID=3082113 RepID=A0ABN8YE00_RANTA|nr:unnamed protein product [Rangifer tarandus platyrhynchus]